METNDSVETNTDSLSVRAEPSRTASEHDLISMLERHWRTTAGPKVRVEHLCVQQGWFSHSVTKTGCRWANDALFLCSYI
ncbi:hypothetical protein R1flu_001331 [Riccia fluitans]|uniref:Uncharacterized protein n=1 Tax=Riccia fluitans TaxID=41844 RepID=A0ABD1Y2Z9_9MARC